MVAGKPFKVMKMRGIELKGKMENGIVQKLRLRGAINMMFFLILENVDDSVIKLAYIRIIQLEGKEETRIDLMLSEARQNFGREYMILFNKMSEIDKQVSA
ncbi:hypothetical protein WSM22_39590 [Cytophagales bacterium WSM2-2]|nr:hypothetical protein WSM22_39590 [Cytophagales bacterium WSM2-2]